MLQNTYTSLFYTQTSGRLLHVSVGLRISWSAPGFHRWKHSRGIIFIMVSDYFWFLDPNSIFPTELTVVRHLTKFTSVLEFVSPAG